jgi:hypothetical protein
MENFSNQKRKKKEYQKIVVNGWTELPKRLKRMVKKLV